jgi:hypothetical protein
MHATKIIFHRPHKFVEGGVAFTPAQIAAATYKVLVAAPNKAQVTYTVPASALAGAAPIVTVPFSSLGFQPVAGVTYSLSVVVDVDATESPVSPTISFTNSLTPAAVDSISVA